MATDHNFRIKNGLEVGGQLIVNSAGALVVSSVQSQLQFNDNVKAKFGNGSDLQVYHDGSHSYVTETGTGNLWLGGSVVNIGTPNASAYYISATQGGAVQLYHNGNEKLTTTSTGIDVTGRIDLDSSATQLLASSDDILRIQTDDGYTEIGAANGGWSHFRTDRARFYFEKGITVDSGLIGSYNEDLQLQHSGVTKVTVTSTSLDITGDLNVTGDINTVSSTNLDITDKVITAGVGGTSSTNDGGGFKLAGANAEFVWDNANTRMTLNKDLNLDGNLRFGTSTFSASGDNTHVHFSSTSALIPHTTTTANNAKLGTSSYRWFGVYGGVADFSGGGSFGGNIVVNKVSPKLSAVATDAGQASVDLSNTALAARWILDSDDLLRVYNQTSAFDAFAVKSSGKVGIGTASPTTPLHITADAPAIRLEDSTSSDNHYLTGNNGELRVQSSGFITMRPGAAISATFLANGNVGIGTTNPTEKLEVSGNIKGTGLLQVENTSDGHVIGKLQINYKSGGNPELRSVGNGEIAFTSPIVLSSNLGLYSDTSSSFFPISAKRAGASIKFSTSPVTNSTYVEAMRILSDGNVGIGTSTPGNKLDVSGVAMFTGGARLGSGTSGEGIYRQMGPTANGVAITTGAFTSSGIKLFVAHQNDGGGVGIGTTAPEAQLHIKAASGTTGVIKIEGGKNTVTSSGEINAQLDFGSNDTSVNGTGNVGGRIASITHNTNGAHVDMAFSTFKQSASPDLAEHMRIKYDGKVGIGTHPTSPLHLVFAGDDGAKIESTTNHASLFIDSHSSYGQYIRFTENNSNKYWINSANGKLQFRPAGTSTAANQVAFDASGNVGIGTTQPVAKLHIHQTGNGDSNSLVVEDDARKIEIGRDQIQVKNLTNSAENLYIQPA